MIVVCVTQCGKGIHFDCPFLMLEIHWSIRNLLKILLELQCVYYSICITNFVAAVFSGLSEHKPNTQSHDQHKNDLNSFIHHQTTSPSFCAPFGKGKFQEWMRPLIKVSFTHVKQICLPASIQSKLHERWHTCLVFVSIVQMHVDSPLLGRGPDTGKWQMRGSWFIYLHPEAFFSIRGKIKKYHMVQDLGSREGEAKFECFSLRDTLVPALTCVQVRYREEVWCMPEIGWAFFV